MRLSLALSVSLLATAALAQLDTLPPNFKPGVLKPLPTDVIVVKSAEPSASDSATPLPENGRVAGEAYRNDYFALSLKLPPQLGEKYKGPPPSDSGKYVLTQLEPSERFTGKDRPLVLLTAQDQFFSLLPDRNAMELIRTKQERLPEYYDTERPPAEVKIAGRSFARFDYTSRVAGIHWIVLATDVRCHTLELILSGRDPESLEKLIGRLDEMKFDSTAAAPLCAANYADAHTLYRVDPAFTDHKHNAIPVRIVIDKKGRVKHVHILSAFPEQARAINDALFQWRFKPYLQNGEPVEVETGLMFGAPPRRAAPATVAASD